MQKRLLNRSNLTLPRIKKIGIAFILFAAYLFYNLFSLQITNHAYYKEKVYDQITTSSAMKASRGNIYDCNMNLLATDKTVWRIFVSSRDIKKREKNDKKNYSAIISKGLSDILSLDYATVLSKISNSNVLDITIKKSVEREKYLEILDFIKKEKLEDLVLYEAQTTRYYPENTLAAHALGFVGSDLQGLYGLEYSYNDILTGKDGYYLYAKDANGNILPTEYATYIPPVNGNSIVTTIESYIQSELEEQLEAIRINHNVKNRVTGIVMDTDSGAILGMATSSPFNPNNPYQLDALSQLELDSSGLQKSDEEYKALKKTLLEEMWSNKAVSETYEPGSTFKIITVSAALDSGSSQVSDTFSCTGYLQVGGWRIRCHKAKGHGAGFSLAYGLQMSCNPAMMTIAERMGAETFYKYVESFGYFEKTGIDLPSEASTIFHQLENIGTTELATASFGQRFKVSVIRQLTSICAIANGGKLVTPYLVEKIIDTEGRVIKEHETNIKRQVVSETIANTVSQILEEGVSGDGGAKNAAVNGYKIAAKTGTSQKFDILDENGNSYLRIGSTVAFSISDEGGIAVIIVVDEPMSSVKYGSVVAAPYVSAFLSNSLPYLGYKSSEEESHIKVESYVGLPVSVAKERLTKLNIEYEIIGQGNVVLSQTPEKDDYILKDIGKIILYTVKDEESYIEVPNVIGMSAAEANSILINKGFNIHIVGINNSSGNATVTAQSIPRGSVVRRGATITLEIIYLDFED